MYKWEGKSFSDTVQHVQHNISLDVALGDTGYHKGELATAVNWNTYLLFIGFIAIIYTFYLFMKKKRKT